MQNIFSNLSFARRRRIAPRASRQRGQSLVELALTMPILLLIMAGTVEVTNLITVYNELEAATREAGRLGSQGSPDANLWPVFLQSLNGTAVNQSSSELYAWSIRPSIKDCSKTTCNNGFKNGSTSTWGVNEYCMNPAGCNGLNSPVTPDMVWNGLSKGNGNDFTSMSNETVTVVVASYNAPTLLNLRFNLLGAQWGRADGKFPMYTYIVFRQEVSSQSAADLAGGCSAYPMALDYSQITDKTTYAPGGGPFSLSFATGGYYFLAWQSTKGLGVNTLVGSIAGYQPKGSLQAPGTSQNGIPTGNVGNYVNPFDSTGTDVQLRRFDWVRVATGVTGLSNGSPTLSSILTAYIGNPNATPPVLPQTLRVIVFEKDKGVATTKVSNPTPSLGGGNFQNPGLGTAPANGTVLQIQEFIIVKIVSIADPAITFRYVDSSDSCGFPQ